MVLEKAWQRKAKLEKRKEMIWWMGGSLWGGRNAIWGIDEWQWRETLDPTVMGTGGDTVQVAVGAEFFLEEGEEPDKCSCYIPLESPLSTLSMKPLFTTYLKYRFAPSPPLLHSSPWQLHYQTYSMVMNLIICLLSVHSQWNRSFMGRDFCLLCLSLHS